MTRNDINVSSVICITNYILCKIEINRMAYIVIYEF